MKGLVNRILIAIDLAILVWWGIFFIWFFLQLMQGHSVNEPVYEIASAEYLIAIILTSFVIAQIPYWLIQLKGDR